MIVLFFTVVFVLFLAAFYISFLGSSCDPKNDPCVFTNPIDALLGTFSMSVGDFEDIVQTFPSSRHQVTLSVSVVSSVMY